MKNALGLVCSVLVFSCAGTPPPPADPPPPAVTAAPTAAPAATQAPVATAAPAASVPADRDPAVMTLALAAAKCPLEEDDFDPNCADFKAWWDARVATEEGTFPTLLSMLEDPDEKIRLLVARPGMQDTGSFFNEPIRARRLIAVAKKETNSWVQHEVSHQIAHIDAEKLGLAAELRELAKNPDLRVGLASSISHHATPLVLELTRAFLQDPSPNVRKAAVMALGGRTPGESPRPEPVCKLITEQLARTDEGAGDLFVAAASSGCTGMPEAVIAEVIKRAADPLKVPVALSSGYMSALSLACGRSKADDVKKKGYKTALAFTSPKITDPWTRVLAVGGLASCDKTLAKKALESLAKDKDKDVARHAQDHLKHM